MSKHLTLSSLQTILPPIKHLIDKKAENIDWNESDPNAKGYIRNKPFYEEVKETFVQNLPTVTLTASIQEGSNNPITGADLDSPLIEGQTYTVIFDDVAYQCLAKNYDGYIMIGNNAIYEYDSGAEDDTGEPFAAEMLPDGSGITFYLPEEKEFTVSISGVEKVTTIKKIDEKFLPPQQEIELGQGSGIGAPGVADHSEMFNDYSNNRALAGYAHVEGSHTTASGFYSHAEGYRTFSKKEAAHAEGSGTTASGQYSHAEGSGTEAKANSSHAEGYITIASGQYSHAEGNDTESFGRSSHAEGIGGEIETGIRISGAENFSRYTINSGSIQVGRVYRYGNIVQKAIEVVDDIAIFSGTFSSASRLDNATIYNSRGISYGDYSHSEGYFNSATGDNAHAEGNFTVAGNKSSHAEGGGTSALGESSHAEGYGTRAVGDYSHAEGYHTLAEGLSAHAEGGETSAIGNYSHVQGQNTLAKTKSLNVIGEYNSINEELVYTINDSAYITMDENTSGYGKMYGNITFDSATGYFSSSSWDGTISTINELNVGDCFGTSYKVKEYYQINSKQTGTIFAKKIRSVSYTESRGKYLHVAGNGTSDSSRSNAHTLDWSGNAWYQGDVYVGGSGQDDAAAEKLATENYVDNRISEIGVIPILTDSITGINYELFVENGTLGMKKTDILGGKVRLKDSATDKNYELYVTNGQLAMKEVE